MSAWRSKVRFPILIAVPDFDAIFSASSCVTALSSLWVVTRLISPMRSASGAAMVSPVSSISMACLRDTLRDSATIGVEQKSPMFTPGVQNMDRSVAIARSQLATNWHPAALASPSISAITGEGWFVTASINSAHLSKRFLKKLRPSSASVRRAVISLRLCPELKTGP
jgi:hypothetical protein